MKKFIISPFYSIINNELFYLGKYRICKLPLEEEIKNDILQREGVLLKINKLKQQKETVLVLEPHADDFALSALGYTLDKYNSIVLNIFSKTNINNFTWINKIHINEDNYEDIRLRESELAVEKILGQKFTSLRLKSKKITQKDDDYIEKKILNATKDILEKNNIKTILVPMGIGNHLDHLIVNNTIIRNYINNKNIKIVLYPEYPYARCRKEYNDKLIELESRYKLKKITMDVEEKLEMLVDTILAYRSQFDDINRDQMLAIIREDCRALAQGNNTNRLTLEYYEIEGE